MSRIRPSLDSELIRLRDNDNRSSVTDSTQPPIRTLPSFTISGAPALVGGIRLADTILSVPHDASVASNGRFLSRFRFGASFPRLQTLALAFPFCPAPMQRRMIAPQL